MSTKSKLKMLHVLLVDAAPIMGKRENEMSD